MMGKRGRVADMPSTSARSVSVMDRISGKNKKNKRKHGVSEDGFGSRDGKKEVGKLGEDLDLDSVEIAGEMSQNSGMNLSDSKVGKRGKQKKLRDGIVIKAAKAQGKNALIPATETAGSELQGHPKKMQNASKKAQEKNVDRKSRLSTSGAESMDLGLDRTTGKDDERSLDSGNNPVSVLEPVGMQIYWKLSSTEASAREIGSIALVKEMMSAQRAFEDKGLGLEERAAEAVLLGSKIEEDELHACAPAVQYAIRRLVRGLASSRECARQGFALALTAVIGVLSCIEAGAVMKLVKKHLGVTTSMSGQDARESLLGQLFACGALIRAGRVVGDATTPVQQDLVKSLTMQLLTLAKKKSFLRQAATHLLLELGDRLAPGPLEDTICSVPLFSESLHEEPGNMSPDTLLLALRLSGKLPTFFHQNCSLLPKSGNLCDIFKQAHLCLLAPCLKESSYTHPRVHSIWHTLLDLLLALNLENSEEHTLAKKKKRKRELKAPEDMKTKTTRLATFWSVVVDGTLLVSSHERKHLAMELLLLALPRLPVPFCVHSILSNTLVRCVLDILSSKDNLLYKSAKNFLIELSKWATADEDRRINVIIALQLHTHGKFDVLSKTRTVKDLVAGLTTKTGCLAFIEILETMFLTGVLPGESSTNSIDVSSSSKNKKQNDAFENKEEDQASSRKDIENQQRIWIVDQMWLLGQQAQLEPTDRHDIEKTLVKFLALYGLFQSSLPADVSEESCPWPQKPLLPQVRTLCITRLRNFLVDAQQATISQKQKHIRVLHEANNDLVATKENLGLFTTEYIKQMEKQPSVALVKPLSEENQESVVHLLSTLRQLNSALQVAEAGQMMDRLEAMASLIVQLLLEMYLAPDVEIEAASEITICCKKAFGDLVEFEVESDANTEQSPAFMDVLVDLLLSLLAQPSAPIRSAAEQVFKSFCNDLTGSGLADMLRIIKKNSTSARRKPIVEVDELVDDDEDIVDVEDSEEDDDDFGDDMASNIEKDLSHDQKVRKRNSSQQEPVNAKRLKPSEVKGVSAQMHQLVENEGDDEDESDDEPESSDLDDDAMFKIDAHLAQILNLRKKGSTSVADENKDPQTQLMHFKFRVLGLLDCFLQKNASSQLVLEALPSLLQVFVNSSSSDGNTHMADRIASILQSKIFKAKQYPKEQDMDQVKVKDLLSKALKLASRSSNKKVRAVAQAACFWLLKVLHGNSALEGEQGDKDVEKLLSSAVEDFFVQKKCRLPSSFFIECFTRFPWLGKSLVGGLLEKCKVTRSEFLRCEALHLVAIALRLKTSKSLKKSKLESPSNNIGASLKPHLMSLSDVILWLLKNLPGKPAKQVEALQFSVSCLETFLAVYPDRPLKDFIDPDEVCAALNELTAPPKGKMANLLLKLKEFQS